MSLAGRWMRRVRFGLLCRSLYRDQYASQIVPSLPAIPCWESQRLIPKRSAGPRATKIGVVSLKALDHHRPNREESAVLRSHCACRMTSGGNRWLAVHRQERALAVGAEAPSLLAGLIVDADGNPMTPTHATKRAKRYRLSPMRSP